ncbi:MAG: RNA methyltransferase [Puniceicoccales bacterium]|nr:RNA methyltransferase [Puniceicoccales bacterium]
MLIGSTHVEIITSRQNDRIKFLCKLRDRVKRDRFEMFLVEGHRELSRAMDNNIPMDSIFFCEKFFRDLTPWDLIQRAENKNIQVCQVSDEVFEKISYCKNCDGILGLAKFWHLDFPHVKLSNNAFILVAESIEKAGNLGALMRSAESAGADVLILCNPVTDIFNPNVIRASQGAVFSLPTVVTSNEKTLKFLEANAVQIFTTTPSAKNIYFHENFTSPTAIIVGSEHDGLSDFWLKNDSVMPIALPQKGMSDSLNVNDAAVIVLYEVVRQRMQKESSRM